MNEKKSDHTQKHKKTTFLYTVIAVLSLTVVAMGTLTFLALNKLSSIQTHVNELELVVEKVSKSSAALQQQADQLRQLQEEASQSDSGISIFGEQFGPSPQNASEAEPDLDSSSGESTGLQEEGTLSPPKGYKEEDESMNNLMSQISALLPSDNGSWSVYVCNLLNDSEGVINEHPMQAASLIKLYIMGAVYENYDSLMQNHGKEQLDSQLMSMITVSDNDAANTLVTWLGKGDSTAGMAVVNSFCRDHGYTSSSMGRLLLQSNANGDNYTSVTDCGKFLKEVYQINAGTAENPTLSHGDSMYYLLKLQQRRNKIPAQMPEGVQVANKTGELASVENDVGIIYDTAKGVDLVVCFMSENLTSVGSAQTWIAESARQIYGYYNE